MTALDRERADRAVVIVLRSRQNLRLQTENAFENSGFEASKIDLVLIGTLDC